MVAGYFWGDYWGGFVYAGVLRQVIVHHATFCINSLAHMAGSHTFDDVRTPRDNFLTALITFGEGYHNFHHEFPNDWRNGIRWFDYDPTKWFIRACSVFGLAFELKEAPVFQIKKGKLVMEQKKLDMRFHELHGTKSLDSLPLMTWAELEQAKADGRKLVAVNGLVHDVSSFIEDHPGGVQLIKSAVGTDGTDAFNGLTGVYKHSSAAHNLLSCLRVARLVAGNGAPAAVAAPNAGKKGK